MLSEARLKKYRKIKEDCNKFNFGASKPGVRGDPGHRVPLGSAPGVCVCVCVCVCACVCMCVRSRACDILYRDPHLTFLSLQTLQGNHPGLQQHQYSNASRANKPSSIHSGNKVIATPSSSSSSFL